MPTTPQNSIFFPDTSTAWATTSDFSTLASSVETALNLRERYTYRWANTAGRNAETTMRQGDTGYQVDTRAEYIYDSGAWRLALPYAEFTGASSTLTSTAYASSSAISIQTSTSTSTTFATSSGSIITCTDPGVYMVSLYGVCSAAVSSAFAMIGVASDATTNFASQIGRAQFGGDNVAAWSSFYRFSAAGGQFFFYWKQNDTTSRNYTSTIRVARVG